MSTAFGLAVVVSGVAAVALADPGPSALELGWLQTATAAGFAGLAWYLIVRAMPALVSTFRQDLAEERKAREEQGEAFTRAIREAAADYREGLANAVAGLDRQAEKYQALVRELLDRADARDGRRPGARAAERGKPPENKGG